MKSDSTKTAVDELNSQSSQIGVLFESSQPSSSTHGVIDQIYDNLAANPIFSGGAGLAGIGIAMALSRRAIILGNAILRRAFIRSLELSNENV
jgi:hypothetical protein